MLVGTFSNYSTGHCERVSSNVADMSDLEVDIILMSLQLDPELPPPAQCWLLLSLLTSAPELDTVDTALSSWPRSTPRKEHRSFLVVELQMKVREVSQSRRRPLLGPSPG